MSYILFDNGVESDEVEITATQCGHEVTGIFDRYLYSNTFNLMPYWPGQVISIYGSQDYTIGPRPFTDNDIAAILYRHGYYNLKGLDLSKFPAAKKIPDGAVA